MRATIAQLAPGDRLSCFHAVYGAAWFAGSVLLGVLDDRSIVRVVIASAGLQAAALPVLPAGRAARRPGIGVAVRPAMP